MSISAANIVNFRVFNTISNINKSNVSTASTQPSTTPNPFNQKGDDFLVTTIFGGISGKNMGKIVFNDTPDVTTEMSVSKTAAFRQVGSSMGIGAAIYGGLSVLGQGIGLATGKQDAAGALANITTDIAMGAASGLGASAGGTLTGLAMKAIGSTGTLGTVVTVIGGMVGASIGANMLESTGMRDSLIQKFGSKKAA